MAFVNGYLSMFPDSDGGVGGLLFWNRIFRENNIYPIIASTNINLKVIYFPFSWDYNSGSYLPKTTLGMINPMIRDTLRTSVSSCVT